MKQRKYKQTYIWLLALSMLSYTACRKSEFLVDPDDIVLSDNGLGTGTVTWTNDKEYILEGKVFVNEGQVLTIEAGTVIRARRGKGAAASALIVSRGGRIVAEGTAIDPIIFTVEGDDLEGSVAFNERGLWGGLIILGSASINTSDGEEHIEGISMDEPRGIYGGENDDDDSGILKYVSIRHGGADLGQDNEINGLTLGGVGRGTTIEKIEVVSNADDGIEIFGGTVNLRYIIVAHCSDDAIDIDLGYRGNGQFLCLLQSREYGDRILEIDGGDDVTTALPLSIPVLYNITAVGRSSEYNNRLITFNDNAGGRIHNSVFINQGEGIELEYSQVRDNSYTQWELDNLEIENCQFYNVNENQQKSLFFVSPLNDENVSDFQNKLDAYFENAGNRIGNPEFPENEKGISLIPDSSLITGSSSPKPDKEFFKEAAYLGAFSDYNWVGEWALSYSEGIIY